MRRLPDELRAEILRELGTKTAQQIAQERAPDGPSAATIRRIAKEAEAERPVGRPAGDWSLGSRMRAEQALALHEVDGMSVAAIAKELGLSPQTVVGYLKEAGVEPRRPIWEGHQRRR